jgi:hypothetical protein
VRGSGTAVFWKNGGIWFPAIWPEARAGILGGRKRAIVMERKEGLGAMLKKINGLDTTRNEWINAC